MQLSFTALLAALALASARDTAKFMKTVPTISNSLVNLGKMEISFHFNGKHQDPLPLNEQNAHGDFYSQPAEESCPCSNFKPPSFLSDPAEIINKILKSNDLFKDPTSNVCCDSAEHMQEVVFEMSPNMQTYPKPPNNIQPFSNILRAPVFPSFIPFSPAASAKPKTLEIIMFPTKKNDVSFDFANLLKPRKTKESNMVKSDVVKSELAMIKEGMHQQSASVKKDLNLMEKKTGDIEIPKEDLNTDAPPVTSVMNAL